MCTFIRCLTRNYLTKLLLKQFAPQQSRSLLPGHRLYTAICIESFRVGAPLLERYFHLLHFRSADPTQLGSLTKEGTVPQSLYPNVSSLPARLSGLRIVDATGGCLNMTEVPTLIQQSSQLPTDTKIASGVADTSFLNLMILRRGNEGTKAGGRVIPGGTEPAAPRHTKGQDQPPLPSG